MLVVSLWPHCKPCKLGTHELGRRVSITHLKITTLSISKYLLSLCWEPGSCPSSLQSGGNARRLPGKSKRRRSRELEEDDLPGAEGPTGHPRAALGEGPICWAKGGGSGHPWSGRGEVCGSFVALFPMTLFCCLGHMLI